MHQVFAGGRLVDIRRGQHDTAAMGLKCCLIGQCIKLVLESFWTGGHQNAVINVQLWHMNASGLRHMFLQESQHTIQNLNIQFEFKSKRHPFLNPIRHLTISERPSDVHTAVSCASIDSMMCNTLSFSSTCRSRACNTISAVIVLISVIQQHSLPPSPLRLACICLSIIYHVILGT